MASSLPQIFYIGDNFLVFDRNHAINLRSKRIVGKLIGCPGQGPSQQIISSGLPYHISRYEAHLVYEQRLATFSRLIEFDDLSVIKKNVIHYEGVVSMLQSQAITDHQRQRREELLRRNIEPIEDDVASFNPTRMKLTVDDKPNTMQSMHYNETIEEDELRKIFDEQSMIDDKKTTVYRDLYQKGYYLTSGSKFGCDFLAYTGDPVEYHAKFALRIMPESEHGCIDLSKVDINELNALHRLCHTANKIVLFVVIVPVVDTLPIQTKLEYWSIKPKEYLSPESSRALVNYPVFSLNGHDGITSNHDHFTLPGISGSVNH